MNIEELQNQGLSREYRIFVPIGDINSQVDAEVEEIAKTFKMAGFREGKVPLSLVKRQVGQDLLAKQVQKSVDVALKQLLEGKNVRPALPPEVSVETFEQDKGLAFKVKFDIFPPVPKVKFEDIKIETIDIEISDADVQKAHPEILKRFTKLKEADAQYEASIGDVVQISFSGTIDGKKFDGGEADNVKIELGSGQFIPGFEEKLKGTKSGDSKTIKVIFPDDYPKLNGQKATFKVEVKSVFNIEGPREITEDFVKKIGLQSLDEFDKILREKLKTDFAILSRFRTKKILFDKLDAMCSFELPPAMLESDFKSIWDEAKEKIDKGQLKQGNKSLKELEADYRKIAERRVKLGLLLAEISKQNDIKIAEADVQAVISMQIAQAPDKEKEIKEFYNDQNNVRRLEGPILEEKAVDFILSKVSVTIKTVSSEEFTQKYANAVDGSETLGAE